MRTLVLGLGNPIVTDDGVGIEIARGIGQRCPGIDVEDTSEAGLALLDYITGYDKLIIIDSIKTGKGEPGDVFKLELGDLKGAMNSTCSHSLDLLSAFQVGQGLGCDMPQSVSIYAVEVKDNSTFSEGCTQEIADKMPSIVREIVREEKL